MVYSKQRPNILFIMTDQMIPMLTGAYGHPVVKTPNLDCLVEEGVRFDAAYTSCPICAPARASLMTGRLVSEIRCYDNAAPLCCDEPTITHYLSNAGYDTVASGKLHYVGPDQLHGFRRRLTTDVYPSSFEWTTAREDEGKVMFEGTTHAGAYVGPSVGVRRWSIYLDYDEETHFRALEYIRSRRAEEDTKRGPKDDRPFFLCVSYHHPHEPFVVTQDLWDMYEGEPIDVPEFPANLDETYSAMDRWLNAFHGVDRVAQVKDPDSIYQVRRSYYGLVSYVDRKVGELLAALESSGLRDDTVIIFTGDHGDMLCEKGMVQKRTFYEWSAGVPMIIRFPDGWQGGTKVAQPVSLMDLAPTVLEMAGVEDWLPMDGRSLMGLMDGSETELRDVFSELHSEGVYAPCFMIRRGKYKYIAIHGRGDQLFDLERDPGEWHNLTGDPQFQEVVADLRARVLGQFDPDEIEKDVRKSLAQRRLIREAMKSNRTHWDYDPPFDATKQYIRGSFGEDDDA
jgi:choline-sulfatase